MQHMILHKILARYLAKNSQKSSSQVTIHIDSTTVPNELSQNLAIRPLGGVIMTLHQCERQNGQFQLMYIYIYLYISSMSFQLVLQDIKLGETHHFSETIQFGEYPLVICCIATKNGH